MRVVEVEEEVKKIAKNVKGRERMAQAFGRVDTSRFERIESSEEHLCIRNSMGEILGYRIRLPSAVFMTFRRSAAALLRILSLYSLQRQVKCVTQGSLVRLLSQGKATPEQRLEERQQLR
jgi:hypothetical protein